VRALADTSMMSGSWELCLVVTPPGRPGGTRALIRDLSQDAVDRIDAAAANLGLSRNEYLRRHFEKGTGPAGERTVTNDDWQRSAEVSADLSDPTVMDSARR
jgi:hypothetical protein